MKQSVQLVISASAGAGQTPGAVLIGMLGGILSAKVVMVTTILAFGYALMHHNCALLHSWVGDLVKTR